MKLCDTHEKQLKSHVNGNMPNLVNASPEQKTLIIDVVRSMMYVQFIMDNKVAAFMPTPNNEEICPLCTCGADHNGEICPKPQSWIEGASQEAENVIAARAHNAVLT